MRAYTRKGMRIKAINKGELDVFGPPGTGCWAKLSHMLLMANFYFGY